MNKKNKPFIVKLLILSIITIIIWIGFEVYRAFTVKPSPPVPPEILSPINPILDQQALDELQNRLNLDDSEIGDTLISGEPVSPEETETETASEEIPETQEEILVEEETTQVATEEANLNE